ncbi:MAG: DedA family protein [Desulfomonilaceae bacterium]
MFHVNSEKLAKLNSWYQKFGKWSLLFGYFIAGVRHFNALFAGASKLQFTAFVLFAYLGA